MTCSFCGSRNASDEIRCRRCGRKPTDRLSEAAAYQTKGALATAPRSEPWEAEPPPPLSRPMSPHPLQRTLFADVGTNVIPIEAYSQPRMEPQREARPKGVAKPRAARRQPAASRRVETQAELEFLPSQASPRKLGTTVEASLYCDAPVATRLHRSLAAALDWSLVLIGYGLFLAGYHLAGGEFSLTKTSVMAMGAVLLALAFTYGLVWALAGGETYGMRWAHLRLLNFDGFPPEPRQRLLRFAGSCLSVLSCGLGFLWSLGDEESFTWQDHVSGTFPTPSGLEDQIFRRR